jgi:uncharacterized protein (TIGR03083 family)
MRRLLPDPDVCLAYPETRGRIIELVRALPESAADDHVPSCPAWTVRDLIAHVAGVPEDLLADRMDGIASDAWTGAQVARHRDESLGAIVESMLATAEHFDAFLPSIPRPSNSQLVMDTVTHEHDLREANGRCDAEDSLAVEVGVPFLLGMLERLSPGLGERVDASGASSFDLLRSLTGRRTIAQMDAVGLDGSAIAGVLLHTPFRPPSSESTTTTL